MWVTAIAYSMIMWITVGALLVTVAARSLALTTLWAWFVVPAFGLAPLSYASAAGLMLVAMVFQVSALSPDALLSAADRAEDDSEGESKAFRPLVYKLVLDTAFLPLALVAVGWLIKAAL